MDLKIWSFAILSVVIVSLISLVGIFFLSLNPRRLRRILLILVSFAVGGLFGDAFIHLLPEAFEKIGSRLVISLFIIAGLLIFFVVEKFIRWRHCHIPTSEQHPHPVVTMNLIGDGVHNFIDGMLIAASYSVSLGLGLTTTLAVILHEIPQEIGDFGVLINGGLSSRRALLYNFFSALAALGGAVAALILGPLVKNFPVYLLPVTAGGFIYIAGSDLIPELQHCEDLKETVIQFLAIVLGIGIMAALLLVG